MLNIPPVIAALLHQDSVPKNVRIIFPNGELPDLTNKDLIRESFRFTESICSREYFRFGLAEASVVEFETVGVPDMRGMTIQAFCEISTDSLSAAEISAIQAGTWDGTLVLAAASDLDYGYFRIPYGVFQVDSCPRNHEAVARRKVKAYSINYFAVPSPFERNKLRAPISAEGQVFLPYAGPMILSMLSYDSDAPLLAAGLTKTAWDVINGTGTSSFQGITVGVTTKAGQTIQLQIVSTSLSHPVDASDYSVSPAVIGLEYSKANIRSFIAAIDASIDDLDIDYSVPATVAGAVQVPISSAEDVRRLIGRDTLVFDGVTYRSSMSAQNGYYDYIHPYYSYVHPGTEYKFSFEPMDYASGDRDFFTFYPGLFRSADGRRIVGRGNVFIPSKIIIAFTVPDSTVTRRTFTMDPLPGAGTYRIRAWQYVPADPAPPLWNTPLRYEANGDIVGESNFVGVYNMSQLVNDYLELLASFASPARAGSTEVFRLSDADPVPILPADYESFWWDEYTGQQVGVIRFSLKDGSDTLVIDYTFGNGTAIYDMSENELLRNSGMTQQEACDFLQTYMVPYLQGMALSTAEADARGLPYVESGDCLDVSAADGQSFRVYLTRRELQGIQRLTDNLEAVGNQLGGAANTSADVQISSGGSGSGGGVPDGGTAGQVLTKNSDANQDVIWADLPLTWRLAGQTTSSTGTVTYPENAKEIFVILKFSGYSFSNMAPVAALPNVWSIGGYWYSSSDTGIANVNHSAANRTIQVRNAKYGGASFTSMEVWYR